jgi:CubicO group peptidase (beta-lactamase class C family)
MMKRLLAGGAVAIALCAAWAMLLVTVAVLESQPETGGDPRTFMQAARDGAKDAQVGNCAIALIEDGHIVDSYVYSPNDPVHYGTLFQMASISKWVTSWGVMALVRQGRLELDVPVSRYLTRWHLPPSEFNNDGVTVRRLLNHTAGLTDGLGYLGFPPGRQVQQLEDSLTYAADRAPEADGHVRVGYAPGSRWKYSGGGFTLLQLLIEEVTHDRFAHFMQQTVFEPLGMTRTTFDETSAVERGIATSYGPGREPETIVRAMHYRFAASAAASLYSDLIDISRFALAHFPGEDGTLPGRGVLPPQMLVDMRAPVVRVFGGGVWGLGTRLYARSGTSDYVFGHDGGNYPAISHAVRIDPVTRSGIVVMSSGSRGFASGVAVDWLYWKSTVNTFGPRLPHLLRTFVIGAAVIVLVMAAWMIYGLRFHGGS